MCQTLSTVFCQSFYIRRRRLRFDVNVFACKLDHTKNLNGFLWQFLDGGRGLWTRNWMAEFWWQSVCICVICVFIVFWEVVFLYSFLLQYFDTVGWVFWPEKNRRSYNLYCVGADVKPCSINQSKYLDPGGRNAHSLDWNYLPQGLLMWSC